FSLLFIAATIVVATIASLLKTRGDAQMDDRELAGGEPVIAAGTQDADEESRVDEETRSTADQSR
ncbi:MAG: TerC family protein, partial [Actinomycetes bacterium]